MCQLLLGICQEAGAVAAYHVNGHFKLLKRQQIVLSSDPEVQSCALDLPAVEPRSTTDARFRGDASAATGSGLAKE